MRQSILMPLQLIAIIIFLCLGMNSQASAESNTETSFSGQETWRLRFLEAAIVQGEKVKLKEIALPIGNMPEDLWLKHAERELWLAPALGKGPMNMTRPRLQEAVMGTMRDLAPYCLFPGSMVLQRGGAVMDKRAIQQLVVKELTPLLHSLPGESTLSDFRLPTAIFLRHSGQTVGLEQPKRLQAGRLSIRFLVHELDGKTTQKITGSVFINVWAETPSAAAPLNRDDLLEPDKINFTRANLAYLRGTPWDGRGGPWRVIRPIGVEQIIYQADLAAIPTIRKGSPVIMLYQGNNINLSAAGEAQKDGFTGETIAVRNTQSRKEIYGIVKDHNTVIVQGLSR